MKKIAALILICTMLISVFAVPTVGFAASCADSITIESADGNLNFSKMQMAKFKFKITNSGEVTGAKAEFYIDGYPQEEYTVNYFAIYSENNENFDVYIPPMIDASVLHTLTMKLTFDDGSEKSINVPFTVNQNLPKIKAEIISNPYSVEPGMEVYYWVKFTFSDTRYGYKFRTGVSLNGVEIPEMASTVTAGNGESKCYVIPAQYTNVDLYFYDFKLIVNPNPGYGEYSTSVSKSVSMTGPKGKILAEINSVVKPVLIRAYVKTNTSAYAYASLTSYRTTIPAGTYVTYMNPDNSKSMRSAKVKLDNGSVYWVPMSNITIVTGSYAKADDLTIEQKEAFVNANGYTSKTAYLIWVNLERQILTVFMGGKGNWKILNTFPICSGKNSTPTPTVQHEISYVTRWVTPGYTCYPVLALYDGYAIHNQPESHSGNVIDPTIGKPASAGCIRMIKKDIQWVHAYVPVGSNVVIY